MATGEQRAEPDSRLKTGCSRSSGQLTGTKISTASVIIIIIIIFLTNIHVMSDTTSRSARSLELRQDGSKQFEVTERHRYTNTAGEQQEKLTCPGRLQKQNRK